MIELDDIITTYDRIAYSFLASNIDAACIRTLLEDKDIHTIYIYGYKGKLRLVQMEWITIARQLGIRITTETTKTKAQLQRLTVRKFI